MTPTAAAMVEMMRIADQIEDLKVQIDYVRRTAGSESHVAKLQQQVQERLMALEESWDHWNSLVLSERLAMV